MDIKACICQEPTPELVRELARSSTAPGVRARADHADDWPGTIESPEGTTLCLVEPPEVLADPEDVDDLATGARLDADDLPLWLVTLTPLGSAAADETARALATGLVNRCGGRAFADGELVATGPDPAELLDPGEQPLSFVAVTATEPPAELLAKVRERHVAAADPVRVDTLDDLTPYVRSDETGDLTPPLWVTTLTADASCRASIALTLAVAAAEFVMNAGASVFDGDGKHLRLPQSELPD